MADEKFGIEKLQSASAVIYNEINTADSQLADGFQTTDAIPMLLQLAPLESILKSTQDIKNEWNDLSDDEIIALATTFNAGLKLRSAELQAKISKSVMGIAYGAIAVRAFLPKKEEVVPSA